MKIEIEKCSSVLDQLKNIVIHPVFSAKDISESISSLDSINDISIYMLEERTYLKDLLPRFRAVVEARGGAGGGAGAESSLPAGWIELIANGTTGPVLGYYNAGRRAIQIAKPMAGGRRKSRRMRY